MTSMQGMQVTFTGVYRYRLYVDLWLFKIAKGWKEVPFVWSAMVDDIGVYEREVTHGVVIGVELYRGLISLYAKAMGMKQVLARFALPVESETVQWKPFRGIELNGTVTLEIAPKPS